MNNLNLTTQQDLKSASIKQLKSWHKELDSLIYKEDCYGVSDMLWLMAIETELMARKI